MKNTVGIYRITSPVGKVYIGQSWNVLKRWAAYRYSKDNKQPFLYNSFKKYGKENHKFEILHELPLDVNQGCMDSYEILYMKLFRDAGIVLMNTREGGSKGKHSNETKKKLSVLKTGRPSGIKPMLGRKHTEATKRIISEKNKGKIQSPERRALISRLHTGKIVSEATKEKMRLFNLGKKLSAETIAKRTATFKLNRLKKQAA